MIEAAPYNSLQRPSSLPKLAGAAPVDPSGNIVLPSGLQEHKKAPHGRGAFLCQRGRRGEEPPEDLGLRRNEFAEKASGPAGHYIQKRFVAEG